MPGVDLNEYQKKLAAEIEELVRKLKESDQNDRKEFAQWHDELAGKAHQLHMELKAAGKEPRHHRYMIQNRGVLPTDRVFYKHIHPAEDLLKFLHDMHANDDPEDATVGAEFAFRVFSRRWGHDDAYQVRRTADGWWIGHLAVEGDCDRAGKPILYHNFEQDGINYPADLPHYFERLWEQAAEHGLSRTEVQRELDRLARWVSICEQNTPGGVFAGYAGPAVTSEAV